MRFTLFATLCLAGSALAAPSALPEEMGQTTRIEINEAEFFNLDLASCSILKCVEVLVAAEAIAVAIASGNVAGLIAAVGGGRKTLCGCAGCIKPLGDFLDKHSVC